MDVGTQRRGSFNASYDPSLETPTTPLTRYHTNMLILLLVDVYAFYKIRNFLKLGTELPNGIIVS